MHHRDRTLSGADGDGMVVDARSPQDAVGKNQGAAICGVLVDEGKAGGPFDMAQRVEKLGAAAAAVIVMPPTTGPWAALGRWPARCFCVVRGGGGGCSNSA
jgi:hypothetical protein